MTSSLAFATIVTNGFNRAAFKGLHTESYFFVIPWLLVNVGVSFLVGTLEIFGGSFAAEVTVNTLGINVEFSCNAFWIFVFEISHSLLDKLFAPSPKDAITFSSLDSRFSRAPSGDYLFAHQL
jgi:hypothetical protein